MSAILINQWKLLPQEYRIYQGRNKYELQPKCSQLLAYLAERPGQVVTKETLLASIWEDRIVSDDVLTTCIRKLRKVLNDDAKCPDVIETINKKGYRMIAKVRPPKTKQWWRRTVTMSIAAIISVTLFTFAMSHSQITIYQFSDKDTPQQRQVKLEEMAGIINANPDETHSIRISMRDN